MVAIKISFDRRGIFFQQEETNYRKKQQQSFIAYRIMDDGFALAANMMNLIDELMFIAVKNVGWYAAYDGSYSGEFNDFFISPVG